MTAISDAIRVWHEQFKIHSYEVGPTKYATPQAICKFLQETASNHASALAPGEAVCLPHELWVLASVSLRMHRYPQWRQTMHIETWPLLRSGSTIRGYRDFNLRDEPGELLGEACSLWLLLSKETRKPVKLPDWMIEASNKSDKPDFLSPVHENEFIGSPTRTYEIEIRASDIDWNLHVNNVCYLEWALETLPHMFRVENKVTQLDITFVAEGNYGMVILSEYFEPQPASPDVHYHRIVEKTSGKLLAMLRLSWSPKERIPAF